MLILTVASSTPLQQRALGVPLPVRKMIAACPGIHFEGAGQKVLYYGMGRDRAGLQFMTNTYGSSAQGYDPYHPLPEFRRKPKGTWDHIWLVYVLNCLDYEEGFQVLMQCWNLLKPTGAIHIAVRGDIIT